MNNETSLEERIAARIDSATAGNLVVSDRAGGVGFANAGQAMEFAKMMAISSLAIPKHLRNNPGACLAIVIQSIEWRLSAFAVANKSYSVNDRLAYESQLIQAVILQRAPIDGRFKVDYSGAGETRVCRVWATLKDSDETVEYVSPPFAKITPKNSPLWKSDPDQQLFYHSGRALCRRHFPDVLLGVYARDEIEDAVSLTPPSAPFLPPRAPKTIEHDPETGEIHETAAISAGEPREEVIWDDPAEEPASDPAGEVVTARAGSLGAAVQEGPALPPESGPSTIPPPAPKPARVRLPAGAKAGDKVTVTGPAVVDPPKTEPVHLHAVAKAEPKPSQASAKVAETTAGGAPPASPAGSSEAPKADEDEAYFKAQAEHLNQPKPLTAGDITRAKGYAAALSGAMSSTGLQKAGGKFWGDTWPEEGTALGNAVATIYDIHMARVNGQSSPVDADAAVAAVLR